MIGLRPATEADKVHLQGLFSLDEWHKREQIENWLSRKDVITFFDATGPIFYMCFTDERPILRLHAQFNCAEQYRTAKAIPTVLQIIKFTARQNGYTQLVLWSESPSLIALMERLGFKKSGEDYVLALEAQIAAIGSVCC
jgi:hypothetical protein